jgi:hypothetical protein
MLYFSTAKAWQRINTNKHESGELEFEFFRFAAIRGSSF